MTHTNSNAMANHEAGAITEIGLVTELTKKREAIDVAEQDSLTLVWGNPAQDDVDEGTVGE